MFRDVSTGLQAEYMTCTQRWRLPASVSKHEEEHAEDDAGGADVDANDDAAQRSFSVPALTQTVPPWRPNTLTAQYNL